MSMSRDDSPTNPARPSGLRGWLRRHRGLALGGAAAAIALGVFVLVWFQPQKLFIDERVDETLPTVAAPPASGADVADAADAADAAGGDMDGEAADDMTGEETDDMTGEETDTGTPGDGGGADMAAEATGPQVLASGDFTGAGRYSTSGQALAIQLEDGSRIVRLEGFETSNGPDLLVYLTSADPGADDEYDQDFVDLGPLKGNIGDQNYELDQGVNLDRYRTVVIWCRRFTVAFGTAQLTAGV